LIFAALTFTAAAQTSAPLVSEQTSQNITSASNPMTITADLSDAPRKLLHADIDIPVNPGPFTFTAAKWIPGTHRPEGPINNITGLFVTANGQSLPWRRDDVDMYAFHVTVPAGVSRIHIHDDFLAVSNGGGVAPNLAMLEWERVMLYPAATPVAQICVVPSIKLPDGWQLGTALTPTGTSGSTTAFAQTTINQLEDSPVIAGRYFKEIPLAPGATPPHFLDAAGDTADSIDFPPAMLAALNKLVAEANAMYGSYHYNTYHFLLSLSDSAGYQGLEHHQSSDNGVGPEGYSDPTEALFNADLLPHEYTHSWNGKYRRPAGLATPDYATPMKDQLLWVYEGMTQYLGGILSARTGFQTPEQYRESLANTAASLDMKTGRVWRSTEDTAVASSILRNTSAAYSNWRRGQDYYPEGELIWLDADTLIRKLTNNQKSLHDFCLVFLAKGGNTGPIVVPYDFNEIVADLNSVAPYDWSAFLTQRLTSLAPHADLEGIERSGWRLIYRDAPTAYQRAGLALSHAISAYYSLGINLHADGTISDVRFFSPAYNAKLAPDAKVIAVNGHVFSASALNTALKNAKSNSAPIRLLIQVGDEIREVSIDYHDGPRYPTLERIPNTPDVLSEIIAPMAGPITTPPPTTPPAPMTVPSPSINPPANYGSQ
jgi:predicted metalloprotease with PDZ domain